MGSDLGRGTAVFVVGAGIMGAGIAQVAAQAGHAVKLFDTREGAAATAVAKLASTLDGPGCQGQARRGRGQARRRAHRRRAPARGRGRLRARGRSDRRERRGQEKPLPRPRGDRRRWLRAGIEHLVDLGHRPGCGPAPAGPLRRHALLQSGAADEAGRGRLGPLDRCPRGRGHRRVEPAMGQDAGACPVDAGLHRQPHRPAVLRRDAGTAPGARCRAGGHRRLPARSGLPHGAVRAHGPDRPRHQLRGDAIGLRCQLRRQALRAFACAARDGRWWLARAKVEPRLLSVSRACRQTLRRRPTRRRSRPAPSSPCTAAGAPWPAGRRR